jgi:hypothetical protein
MSLYPRTQNNAKLAATVVKMLDMAIMGQEQINEFLPALGAMLGRAAGMAAGANISRNIQDYIDEKISR